MREEEEEWIWYFPFCFSSVMCIPNTKVPTVRGGGGRVVVGVMLCPASLCTRQRRRRRRHCEKVFVVCRRRIIVPKIPPLPLLVSRKASTRVHTLTALKFSTLHSDGFYSCIFFSCLCTFWSETCWSRRLYKHRRTYKLTHDYWRKIVGNGFVEWRVFSRYNKGEDDEESKDQV